LPTGGGAAESKDPPSPEGAPSLMGTGGYAYIKIRSGMREMGQSMQREEDTIFLTWCGSFGGIGTAKSGGAETEEVVRDRLNWGIMDQRRLCKSRMASSAARTW
jgi:hypothetical protein